MFALLGAAAVLLLLVPLVLLLVPLRTWVSLLVRLLYMGAVLGMVSAGGLAWSGDLTNAASIAAGTVAMLLAAWGLQRFADVLS